MTENISLFFNSLEGAFAENTIRAYKSDFAHYDQWCRENQVQTDEINEQQMASYIENMGDTLSTATIRRRVASLSRIFKLMSQADPTQATEVILTLKRLHRKLGRLQKQATPLTQDILKKLIATCSKDIVGYRNKVLLRLGYETMRRRSEICSFRFEDIKRLPNQNAALLLRHSKTDQYGDGKLIPISDELFKLIFKWKKVANIDEGYILRAFYKNHHVRNKLNPAAINKILKELQRKARMTDMEPLTGHSFRVGAAIDMLDQGMPLERIMLRGGWKSENTAMKYLRNWQDHWVYNEPL